VLADTPFGRIGLTVCYDVRFPHLYRRLAQAGRDHDGACRLQPHDRGGALGNPAARPRDRDGLLGCWPPRRPAFHPETAGKGRRTHGHSLVVGPWGEVVADAGTEPGVTFAEIDLARSGRRRAACPSLTHDRPFEGP
jgi:deaminated glutathione amidase